MAVAIDKSAAGLTITHLTSLDSHVAITGNVPSAVVEGDAILAFFIHRGTGNPDTITPPEAFTPLQNGMGGNGSFKTHSWLGYRIAGASEPASYDWAFSANIADKTIILLRITGADASFFEALAFDDDEYGTTVTAPSVTSLTDDATLLTIVAGKQAATFNGSLPTDMTRITGGTSRANSNATNWEISEQLLGEAGPTGVRTYTDYYSANAYVTSYSLVIKPAAEASGPTIVDITTVATTTIVVDIDNPEEITTIELIHADNTFPLDDWESMIVAEADLRVSITLDRDNLPFVGLATVRFNMEGDVTLDGVTSLISESGTQAINVESPNVVSGLAGYVELDAFEDGDQYQVRHSVSGLFIGLFSDTTLEFNLPPPFVIEVRTYDHSTGLVSTWRDVNIVEPSEQIEGTGGLHRLGFRFGF